MTGSLVCVRCARVFRNKIWKRQKKKEKKMKTERGRERTELNDIQALCDCRIGSQRLKPTASTRDDTICCVDI